MQSERPRRRPNPVYFFLRRVGGESGEQALLALGFLAGALAFLWAGYLGNPADPNPFIREPWTLFGLYCAIMFVLEASILLDPGLPETWKPSRPRVAATLSVTAAWIIAVCATYIGVTYGRAGVIAWIKRALPEVLLVSQWIGSSRQVLFALANLLCVIVLWLGIRFFSYDPEDSSSGDRTTFRGERFIGDLVLSACFSVTLAWVFFAPFWQNAAALAASVRLQGGGKPSFTVCDLTFLPYHSPCALPPYGVTTIFFLDLFILPLLYALVALIMLGFAAWHKALATGRSDEFAGVFLAALRDVLRRRVTIPNLLLSLRFFWPLLLLLAAVLEGIAARSSEFYLYDVAMAPKWWIFRQGAFGPALGLQLASVAALLVALLATVSAATLQVVPRARRGANLRLRLAFIWRHIRYWADMSAQAYWVASLVFSMINLAALIGVAQWESVTGKYLAGYHWAPFAQPDPLLMLSFVWFCVSAVRRYRRRGASPAIQIPTPERTPGDGDGISSDADLPSREAETTERIGLS